MSCVKVEVAVLGPPVPNSPYGLCGRKATLNLDCSTHRAQELCESRGDRLGHLVPNKPYGFCGREGLLTELRAV